MSDLRTNKRGNLQLLCNQSHSDTEIAHRKFPEYGCFIQNETRGA